MSRHQGMIVLHAVAADVTTQAAALMKEAQMLANELAAVMSKIHGGGRWDGIVDHDCPFALIRCCPPAETAKPANPASRKRGRKK